LDIEPLKVGYTSFGWGQSAQLPQIYAGFGIDVAFIGKRVSPQRAPKSEFLWVGTDGTELLTSRFGDQGRHNFYFSVILPGTLGRDYESKEFNFEWQEGTLPYHRADMENYRSDYFQLRPSFSLDIEKIRKGFIRLWEGTGESVLLHDRLFMQGCDYVGPHPLMSQVIDIINKEFDDFNVVETDLESFASVLNEKVSKKHLTRVYGELRDGPAYKCTMNALATRIDIKQLNKQAENKLIRVAEPLAFMAEIVGGVYPSAFFDRAWEYLLVSQSHDSINGVTTDKTTNDVKYRLNQAIEIADVITDDAIRTITKCIKLPADKPDAIYMVVFNTTNNTQRKVLSAVIDTPRQDSVFSYCVRDSEGNEVDIQPAAHEKDSVPITDIYGTRSRVFETDKHYFHFETEVPPFGYRVLSFEPESTYSDSAFQVSPKPTKKPLAHGCKFMENEWVQINFNNNGTFNIYDKKSGRSFESLGYFEDGGDVGNYWHWQKPQHDKIFDSTGCCCKRYVAEKGHLLSTVVTEVDMSLPKKTTYAGRNSQYEKVTFITMVTLRRFSPLVEVELRFENRITDHRLRLMIPTGIQAQESTSAGHFGVVSRPISPVTDERGYYKEDVLQHPMGLFVDVSDNKCGLAVISSSFTEYEVLDDSSRTLALTLLRSMDAKICAEHRVPGASHHVQKLSQLPGKQFFRYALYPHQGNWQEARVYRYAQDFITPKPIVQAGTNGAGQKELLKSFLEISNDELVVSCLKRAERDSGYILRLFNPTDEKIEAKVEISEILKDAYIVNLAEEITRDIPVTNNVVKVMVGPHKISSVLLQIQFEQSDK
jgi:mannosylglycerate hydrolase